jgi:anti-sigma regulatory factor (Ser/Thr protein kinase)
MDRMGFFQAVEPWAKQKGDGWRRAFPRSRGDSPVLLELTKIEEADDTQGAVERVRKKADTLLRRQFNYTSDDIAKFCTALSETCENVCMHSQDWGFIAIQSYRDKVKMAIFDLGIGIQSSLAEKADRLGKRWSDCDSILQAMEWGVSRFDDRGRGIGLAGVKDIVRKWRGSMQIRSGTGKIGVNTQRMRGMAIPDLPHFPGTQICITLPKLSVNVAKEECAEYEISF